MIPKYYFGPFLVQKWSKNGPGGHLGATWGLSGVHFWVPGGSLGARGRFALIFVSFLVPFGGPFGVHLGVHFGSILGPFSRSISGSLFGPLGHPVGPIRGPFRGHFGVQNAPKTDPGSGHQKNTPPRGPPGPKFGPEGVPRHLESVDFVLGFIRKTENRRFGARTRDETKNGAKMGPEMVKK